MKGTRRACAQERLLFLTALLAICLFSAPVIARDLIPVYVDEYGVAIRSEPGEDPHLRIKEFIPNDENYTTVTLSESRDGPNPFVLCGEEGLYGRSRTLCGLRILLRMMVYALPR